MPQYLFAYGTLQPGLAPASIRTAVGRLVPVGGGAVPGRLYDLGAYPGATFDGAGGTVHGTVLKLPADDAAAVLAALDAYEGVPDLYHRRPVTVTLAGGGELSCWAYAYNGDVTAGRPIPSGTYAPEHRP